MGENKIPILEQALISRTLLGEGYVLMYQAIPYIVPLCSLPEVQVCLSMLVLCCESTLLLLYIPRTASKRTSLVLLGNAPVSSWEYSRTGGGASPT